MKYILIALSLLSITFPSEAIHAKRINMMKQALAKAVQSNAEGEQPGDNPVTIENSEQEIQAPESLPEPVIVEQSTFWERAEQETKKDEPVAESQADPKFLVTAAPVPPTCNQGSGSIAAFVSNGTPPYTVSISMTGSPVALQIQTATSPTQTEFIFSGLQVEDTPKQPAYTITANDSATPGNSASVGVTFPNPTGSTGLTLGVSTVLNVTCPSGSNGSITPVVTTATGIAHLTNFTITNVATGVTTPLPAPTTSVTALPVYGPTFGGLAAGTYVVQVNAVPTTTPPATVCAVGLALVTQPSPLVATAVLNDTNGSVTITVSGGTPGTPPTYTLVFNGVAQTPGAGPFTITGLTAGNYNYTVTDSAGCTASFCIRGPSTNSITNFITTKYCVGGCVTPPVTATSAAA